MTLRIHKASNAATPIPNELIEDPNLSWGAKGLMAYILSKPEASIEIEDVIHRSSTHPEIAMAFVAELRNAGWIEL